MAFNSLDIITGVEKLRPEDLLQREMPGSVNDAFARARAWHRENWFVEQTIRLRCLFYNFGLKLVPSRASAKKRVAAIWDDPTNPIRAALVRYINEVWREWALCDTVISFWRQAAKTTPFLLLPETCKYTDAMGVEKLYVKMACKKADLAATVGGITGNAATRYTNGSEILLSEAHDEYYAVLTRGLRGQGFGWPRLRTVFRTLSQNESMEVGESMLAFAGRLVEREHLIGFEVRSGANAARQETYLWKKKRADEIQKFYQGRAGFAETVKQFDQKTQYNWVPAAFYDAKKWESIIDRLLWWAGPVGYMVVARTPNPFLLPMFKHEAIGERELVGAHCARVIEEGFGLPVSLEWGNQCFEDPRLAWSMAQSLAEMGPLSLTTALKLAGFDPELEGKQKLDELKRRSEMEPLYDKNHGNHPGNPGKPAGQPNAKKNGEVEV